MIRIAISVEAFASTLPFGSVGYEPELNAKGERFVWLTPAIVDRLGGMRGPGESYSDVILRLVANQNEEQAKSLDPEPRATGWPDI
jgi:hypothetical protein